MIKPVSIFETCSFLFFLLLLSSSKCCSDSVAAAAAAAVAADDEFDQVVSEKVQNLRIRGASIAYFDSNTMTEPIVRGYGKVSASRTSQTVTPGTTFMIASISKVFTAAALAVLLDQGYINSIDDDICNVLPSDYTQYNMNMCRNPAYPTMKITWRMLMTHRSSMKGNIPDARNARGKKISPSYGPEGGYDTSAPAVGNPTCPLSNITDFYHTILTNAPNAATDVGSGVIVQGNKPLNWFELSGQGGMWQTNNRPGSKSVYSNAAYGLISALIELAVMKKNGGGQSFTAFSFEHIFQPLGMSHTAWFRNDLPDGTLEAIPVEYTNNNNKKWKDAGHYCFIDYASGELRTSAKDISKWAQYFINDDESTTTQLLWSKAIGQKMHQCQEQDVNGNLLSKRNCETGYGWILLNNSMKTKSSTDGWLRNGFANYDWTNGIWHDGAEIGSQTNLIILPNAGVYVAVLTNTDLNSDMAAQQLTQAVVQAPLPVTPSIPVPVTPTTPAPVIPPPPTLPPNPDPTLHPTMAPTHVPTVPPTAEPQPNNDNNNNNNNDNDNNEEENEDDCPKNNDELKFVLQLKTDHYPIDTKWTLKRNNKVIKRVGYNTYKKKYTKYNESFCIRDTGKYVLTIFDKFGDGLTEGPPKGWYKIFVDNVLKKKRNGKFKKRQATKWKLVRP